MAVSVASGSDVSVGTYRCTNCGCRIRIESERTMPPCPECMNGRWKPESGGDILEDLNPGRE